MSLMSSLTDYIEADATWDATMHERLHPVQYPQGEAGPWAVYRLDDETGEYSIDGPAETLMAEVEFKILSASYDQAHALVKVLRNRIDGFRGTMGDIVVTHIRWMTSRDGEVADEVLGLYPVICKVSVWYVDA